MIGWTVVASSGTLALRTNLFCEGQGEENDWSYRYSPPQRPLEPRGKEVGEIAYSLVE